MKLQVIVLSLACLLTIGCSGGYHLMSAMCNDGVVDHIIVNVDYLSEAEKTVMLERQRPRLCQLHNGVFKARPDFEF